MSVGRTRLAAEARFRLADHELERCDAHDLPATPHPGELDTARDARRAEAKQVAPQYDQVMSHRRPASTSTSTSTQAADVVTGGHA